MAGLPETIRQMAEFSPIEDILLPILRAGLPGISVQSVIEKDQTFPMVLARRSSTASSWTDGDPRFIDASSVFIFAFCEDPNGDEDAALLSEAVRVVLRDAYRNQVVVPGRGHISALHMVAPPRRVADWATSSGPVQYADLPTGVWRYEAHYDIDFRRAPTLRFENNS